MMMSGAALLLGLCEPMMTGLGGDLFALIWPHDANRPIALNASGRRCAAHCAQCFGPRTCGG